MDLSPNIAASILWELRFIRWLLIALLIAVGYCVFAFVVISNRLSDVGDDLRKQRQEKRQQTELEDLISRGLSKSAKFAAIEWIAREPKQAYAHWYLAKAHYQLGELIEAKAAFQATLEVSPNWADAVTPWLEKIEDEISARGPKLVN